MKEEYKCPHCGGTGKIIVSGVENDYVTTCKQCKGTGQRLITITLEEYENLKSYEGGDGK